GWEGCVERLDQRAIAVLWVPKIELGADVSRAQRRHHALIIGDAVAIEHCDHDRACCCLLAELAERGERGLQARHADRKTGCRHRLAAEAGDQPVIASAAAYRPEAHPSTPFLFYFQSYP